MPIRLSAWNFYPFWPLQWHQYWASKGSPGRTGRSRTDPRCAPNAGLKGWLETSPESTHHLRDRNEMMHPIALFLGHFRRCPARNHRMLASRFCPLRQCPVCPTLHNRWARHSRQTPIRPLRPRLPRSHGRWEVAPSAVRWWHLPLRAGSTNFALYFTGATISKP